MLRRYISRLLAPADALGGGSGSDTAELPPNSVGDFMTGLGSLDDTPEPPPKKEEGTPNGDAAKKPDGDSSSASGATGDNAAAATKSKLDANANKPATDAPAKGADKTDAKPGATDDDKWPRSSSDWETFKTRRKEEREKAKAELAAREARIAELQTQLKTFEETAGQGAKETPETQVELDRLKKENEALSETIRLSDVTQHPKWKAHFGNLEREQMELATAILGDEKGKKFAEIASIPDNNTALAEFKKAQMNEFLSDLTAYEQSAIANVTTELMRINRQKQAEIKKNEEHVAKIREQRDAGAKTMQASREKVFNSTLNQLADPEKGLALFKKKTGEGSEEWNSQIDGMIANAKRFFFGAKDIKAEEIATAAMHAAAMPTLLKAWESDLASKDKEIAKLQEQVKRLSSATPGGLRGGEGAGGEGAAGGARSAGVKAGMTPEEATKSLVSQWAEGMQ